MRAYASRLQDLGHNVVSTWVFRTEPNVTDLDTPEAEAVAVEDLQDVLRSDCVLLFAETPRTPTRAGRMVELGIGIGTGKRLICIGGKENVFTSLPQVEHFDSFTELDAYLTLRRPLRLVSSGGSRRTRQKRWRPSMSDFTELRRANVAREKERDPTGLITPSYRACELGGEIAEAIIALNLCKKIERERLGLPGSRATIEQLASELADCVIASDLLALQYGIDLEAAIVSKFNATSKQLKLRTKLKAA
jgi:NTP pyrophosphatase (non-canonical NTP hydrolase)